MVKVTVRSQVNKGGKASKAYFGMRRRHIRGGKAKRTVSKKAMVKSRRAIVETKSRIQSDLFTQGAATIPQPKTFVPIDGVFKFLPLHAYTFMEQGLGEDQMLGQSIFSKYLNAKVQIRFQGGANQIADRPYPMELICGWVKGPPNWTSFTTPTVNTALPSDLSAWVVERVSEYFNSRADKLEFIPKRDSTIDITYRRKIRPNQNRNTVMNPNSNSLTLEGHVPDVMLYPKWRTMKKVYYERGNTVEVSSRPNYYPNYSRIPFMILYSSNFAGEDGTKPLQPQEIPEVAYNVSHYFTDS